MWPLAIAGMALQIYGNYQANQAQAQAEQRNAAFYSYQARYAAIAGAREQQIFANQATYAKGQRVSAIAASGVSLTSGSAVEVMAAQNANALNEANAIWMKTNLQTTEANLRATASEDKANMLSSPDNNLMQAGGTMLTATSRYWNMVQTRDNKYSGYSSGGTIEG